MDDGQPALVKEALKSLQFRMKAEARADFADRAGIEAQGGPVTAVLIVLVRDDGVQPVVSSS